MSLLDVYENKVIEHKLKSDNIQQQAIKILDRISKEISNKKKPSLFGLSFSNKKYPSIKGLYMWGGVGRGKTFIMDIFFDNLDTSKKTRQHFAHFMKNVHAMLKKYKGHKLPIRKVALEIANESQIICFDEFFVEDIADAMILGNIFRELFNLGVVLVATSNIHPDKLYANGLQRDLFMKTIVLLTDNVEILNLDSGVDYRFLQARKYNNYYFPYNEDTRGVFFDKFLSEDDSAPEKNTSISILGRQLPVILLCARSICLDMLVICGHGRSAHDYIEICSRFDSIYIYNLRSFNNSIRGDDYENVARRFISLIDECYDQGKKVVIVAEDDFVKIYQGQRLSFEFQRTISRLNDMQLDSYRAVRKGE